METPPTIQTKELTTTLIYRKDTTRLAALKYKLQALGIHLKSKPDVITYLLDKEETA